jgi:uncharacterized membrane protein YphA (DoxX/SURF4 family)
VILVNSTLAVGQIAVGSVWLHQGLWCKVLGMDARHLKIVAGVPGLGHHPVAATRTIGLLEVALATWILAGRRPRTAAVLQSVALVAMNAGGFRWAGPAIARPRALIGRNVAFLALAWVAALGEGRR